MMKGDLDRLSDKERETLRLLGRGHEAKSIASALGLSVHTVNERLRATRRKLGVSSSREAARLLLAHEAGSAGANYSAYKEIGVASSPATQDPARHRLSFFAIGVVMLVGLVAVIMSSFGGGNAEPAAAKIVRPAQAMSTLPGLFLATDYPAEALAQGAQGSTTVHLKVSEVGRVGRCVVERSSGNAALDRATCRVITSRGRFRPAVDAAGRPVASIYPSTIHWLLHEEAGSGTQARP